MQYIKNNLTFKNKYQEKNIRNKFITRFDNKLFKNFKKLLKICNKLNFNTTNYKYLKRK